jgi:hypothetical protein
MTKLTKKQESLLNELIKDFDGDTEAVMGKAELWGIGLRHRPKRLGTQNTANMSFRKR